MTGIVPRSCLLSMLSPESARLTDAALVEPVRFEDGLQRHLDSDCSVHAVDDGDVPSDSQVKARPQADLEVVLSRSPADLHELPTIELTRLHHPKRSSSEAVLDEHFNDEDDDSRQDEPYENRLDPLSQRHVSPDGGGWGTERAPTGPRPKGFAPLMRLIHPNVA